MILLSITIHSNDIDWPAWIQASASIFAAVGLVWTLYLQKQATKAQLIATQDQLIVNRAQLKVAELDYRRFLTEIEPRWDFSNFLYDESSGKGRYDLFLTNTPAYDVDFKFRSKAGAVAHDLVESNEFPLDYNVGEACNMIFEITDKAKFFKDVHYMNYMTHIITYHDKIGNLYEQELVVLPLKKHVIKSTPTLKVPIKM